MSEKRECPGCLQMVSVNKNGSLRKHPDCGPVSDPAPTVEETTTQGDDVDEKGPWFGAMYVGKCGSCEDPIDEGDRIRADGTGGYECGVCGDSPATVIPDPAPATDWQAQAREAARRHVAAPRENPNDPVELGDRDFEAQQFLDPGPAYSKAFTPTAITANQFLDPDTAQDVKPIMSVSGQPKKVRRDHLKRYAVVLPGETELETYKSSGNPVGRTRATTFNKAATDKKNINDWGKRNVVIGAARRRDLLLRAHGLTHEHDKDRLNAIVLELEEAAGAKVGSDLGTYLHDFTEYMDAGEKTWQDAPKEFQRSLALYSQALADAGLEPIRSLIERTTIIREYGWVCGTFDRVFYHRPSGQYIIGDLKTGKTMDYGKNEVECQLWTYAHGVNQNGIYDWNTDTWEKPDTGSDLPVLMRVSETVGVVIHMPVQGPKEGTVELLWADLENGRRHAELCHAVRSQPSGKMRGWGDGPSAPTMTPPAPAPAAAVARALDNREFTRSTWPKRFKAVTSSEQASALWREAKAEGVHPLVLGTLVGMAQQRLRELGVRG